MDIAVELLRQNGSSPTTGVQLAHKELITKLGRLEFWIISSQDRSFHNQKNAEYLAPTTTIPRRDAPYIGPIDNGRQRSMSEPAPRTAAPLHTASMRGCNQCCIPADDRERSHSSSYEHAAQEEKKRHDLIIQENEKDDQRLPHETKSLVSFRGWVRAHSIKVAHTERVYVDEEISAAHLLNLRR